MRVGKYIHCLKDTIEYFSTKYFFKGVKCTRRLLGYMNSQGREHFVKLYIPKEQVFVLGDGNMQILGAFSETGKPPNFIFIMESLIWIYIFNINIA